MISWIIIGLSTGNAEVYVDSQVVGQQQGSLVLDDSNTESGHITMVVYTQFVRIQRKIQDISIRSES